jgi:transposase
MTEKYTLETRIEVVSYVLKKNHSKRAAARKYRIAKSTVRKWVYAYENHGLEGLTLKDNFYTGYFKANVVRYMLENELSASITAAEFNIPSHSTICRWRHIYLTQGEDALQEERQEHPISIAKIENKKSKKIVKEEKKELLAEIKRLKMENDYLKKLNALIQEKEKSMKETK